MLFLEFLHVSWMVESAYFLYNNFYAYVSLATFIPAVDIKDVVVVHGIAKNWLTGCKIKTSLRKAQIIGEKWITRTVPVILPIFL